MMEENGQVGDDAAADGTHNFLSSFSQSSKPPTMDGHNSQPSLAIFLAAASSVIHIFN